MQPVFAVHIRLDASATSCCLNQNPPLSVIRVIPGRYGICDPDLNPDPDTHATRKSMYHMVQRPDGRIPSLAHESGLALE